MSRSVNKFPVLYRAGPNIIRYYKKLNKRTHRQFIREQLAHERYDEAYVCRHFKALRRNVDEGREWPVSNPVVTQIRPVVYGRYHFPHLEDEQLADRKRALRK